MIFVVFVTVVMQGHKVRCNIELLWVQSPLEEMKYLFKFIFSFVGSGVKGKVPR